MTIIRPELVHFEATDRLILPGLLFEPKRPSGTAAVWLHGNGDASIFYAERTNPLAEAFVRRGIAFFPFNNRGAYLAKRLSRSGSRRRKDVIRGTGYEKIAEAVHDIEGAIGFLGDRGHRRIFLLGHSSGANKICVYHYRRRENGVAGYVLLGGADDMGLYHEQWGTRRFLAMLALAKERIRQRRGSEIAPLHLTPFPISWTSLHDTINPEGEYNIFPFLGAMRGERLSRKSPFREFRAINKPTLVAYGGEDQFCFDDVEGCVRILKGEVDGRKEFTFRILEDADHGFHGREEDLGRMIVQWIRRIAR
jgi:pimeloyl-ACP methyl ester carboxylesterase